MSYLSDTTVLVLGLGESGLAMARWCARCGADVRVWDSREQPANAAALAEQVPAAQWLRGALTEDALDDVKLVLKSPGLSPFDPAIAGVLQRAAFGPREAVSSRALASGKPGREPLDPGANPVLKIAAWLRENL